MVKWHIIQSSSYFSLCLRHILSICAYAGFACILELLAEPFYILSQTLVLLKLRLLVETAATLSRCMITYILILKQPSLVSSRAMLCILNHRGVLTVLTYFSEESSKLYFTKTVCLILSSNGIYTALYYLGN